MAVRLAGSTPICASLVTISLARKPASIKRRVSPCSTKVQLPPLPLPKTQMRMRCHPSAKIINSKIEFVQISNYNDTVFGTHKQIGRNSPDVLQCDGRNTFQHFFRRDLSSMMDIILRQVEHAIRRRFQSKHQAS